MKQDDIERINRFVRLESPESNKGMMICIWVMIGFVLMAFVGNCAMLKSNLLSSQWMLFVPFAAFLIIWGIILYRTLEKRQIVFFLYEFLSGLFLTIGMFSIGYSITIEMAHGSALLPIFLSALGILLLFLLTIYRVKFFYGKIKLKEMQSKKEIKKRKKLVSTLTIIILIGAFVFWLWLKNTSQNSQYIAYTVLAFLLGYAMSMYMVFIGNYIIAKKYKDIVYLYDAQKLKK